MTKNEHFENYKAEPAAIPASPAEHEVPMAKFKPLGEMGTRPEVSPTAITDIIDRYVQDGRPPATAFLWAIAETAPDVMDKATEAAIKAGNTAAAGADLRADLLGIAADGHEEIVAMLENIGMTMA